MSALDIIRLRAVFNKIITAEENHIELDEDEFGVWVDAISIPVSVKALLQ